MRTVDDENTNLEKILIQTVKTKHPKTIKQLLEMVRQQHSISQEKIMAEILNLEKQGKLALKEDDKQSIPATLTNYLSSSPSYWYWVTIALTIIATASIFTIPEDFYPLTFIRYMLGAVLVLFLPGYSLTKALVPKELGNIERIALSIGTSLALIAILGLILYYTSLGIQTIHIILSFLTLTIIFATIAIMREQRVNTMRHSVFMKNRS